MALGKLSAFTKLNPKNQEAPVGPSEGPGVGAGSRGGEKLSTLDRIMQETKPFVEKGAKAAGKKGFEMLDKYLNPPTEADLQGSDPNAMAQQRAGERDMSPYQAAPTYELPSMPTDVSAAMPTPNVWQPGNATEAATTVDPSQIFSETGSAPMGVEGASGVLGGGGFTDLAMGGAGALLGAAPGIIGRAAGVDPETGAILNAAGQVIGMVGAPALAGAVGVGGAAGAAGAAAGGGLAGAGAGIAAAGPALIAAAPIAALMIMQQVLASRDNADAMRSMKIRLKNIQSQLPGEISQIMGIPQIVAGIDPNNPDKTAATLKQLNDVQKGYQEGGWESYQKGGGTTVGGGSAGQDITANLPGVQSTLDQLSPYFQALDAGRLQAEDVLGKFGWNGDKIATETGRYIGPEEWGLILNSPGLDVSRTGGTPGFNPTFRDALLPSFMQGGGPQTQGTQWDMSQEGGPSSTFVDRALNTPADLLGLKSLGMPDLPDGRSYNLSDIRNYTSPGGAGPAGFTRDTPLGAVAPSVEDAINKIQPGDFAAKLPEFLAQYGGVNPGIASYLNGGTPTGFSSLGTNSSAGAPAGVGTPGGQKSNLQGTLGFAGLTGPLNEIRGGDNPNQI